MIDRENQAFELEANNFWYSFYFKRSFLASIKFSKENQSCLKTSNDSKIRISTRNSCFRNKEQIIKTGLLAQLHS